MANNKNTTTINSTVLLNKIGELADAIKGLSQSGSTGQTNQELVIAANNLLDTFFNQLSGPIFNPSRILRDTKPDVADYNTNVNNILSDLKILFAELANIANLEVANFNFMVSDSNRLMGRMKSVYSKLGDYILFSQDPNKDSIYYTDSFNNMDRVDFNSKLITSTQANIDQNQGIVTLPLKTQAFTPLQLTIAPVINSNSNGTPGNNHEANAQPHNSIVDILDDNADTWFEYENVVTDSKTVQAPLVLDITLNLGTSQIINYIRINPNNFGTQTSIDIETIETSSDGRTFSSIKSDIPVAGFQGANDTDLFTIAPASSKFAGQGIYSFTPRYAKFIHLTFKQSTPYGIKDDTGTIRSRYAIGIRDVEVAAIPYESEGEVVSAIYTLEDQAKKVAVISNQFPSINFSLVDIEHYVSPDDGLTWTQVNPTNLEINNEDIQSVVSFNSMDADSVNTSSPVNSLRYKAVLKRKDDNFNNPANLDLGNTISTSELLPVPNSSPFTLTLHGKPIKSTIKVMDPTFGSRGNNNTRYTMGTGNGAAQSFILPFINIKKDKQKYYDGDVFQIQELDPEEIWVNGELWQRGNLSLATSLDKVYELNYVTGQVRFGNGINGLAPPTGATIDLKFKPERVSFVGEDRIATLNYQTSNDQKSFTITQNGAIVTASSLITKQAYSTQLPNKNIDRFFTPTFSNTSIFAHEKVYEDGFTELVSSGDYSIDYVNGSVYSKVQSPATSDITINYRYMQTQVLDETQWEFVDGSNYTQIRINDNNFLSLPKVNEYLSPGNKYIVLEHFSIIQNSVQFSGGAASTTFFKEVPFVDGVTELLTAVSAIENITDFPVYGVNVYTFRLPISASTDLKVAFSNTSIFNIEVTDSAAVDAPGKYYVDRFHNKLYLFGSTGLGTVSYYYNDKMKSNNGVYSINYATGEIYTASPIGDNIVVAYNYSNYVAQYNIARNVDSANFTYDDTNNAVIVNEREILSRINLAKKDSTQTSFYQVLYQTAEGNAEELKALAPYFSPILRDYALKIITEGSLLY